MDVLADSIMNFKEVFVESDEKEVKEFIVTTEDLLLKFLNFLEFWIQKNTEKDLVIFLVKALG